MSTLPTIQISLGFALAGRRRPFGEQLFAANRKTIGCVFGPSPIIAYTDFADKPTAEQWINPEHPNRWTRKDCKAAGINKKSLFITELFAKLCIYPHSLAELDAAQTSTTAPTDPLMRDFREHLCSTGVLVVNTSEGLRFLDEQNGEHRYLSPFRGGCPDIRNMSRLLRGHTNKPPEARLARLLSISPPQ